MGFKLTAPAPARRGAIMMWADCAPRITGQEVRTQDLHAYALPVGNFTVPLIRLEETGAYLNGDVNASRAHARFLKSRTPVRPYTMPMFSSGSHFTAKVGVGNSDPVKYYHLLVDIGSSVTWIKEYNAETDTSELTGHKVRIRYGPVVLEGNEYLDEVTLAPGLVIPDQSIGSISPSSIKLDRFKFQGILGLGPARLNPNTNELIPTVMNNLKLKGLKEVFSIYIPPTASPGNTEGRLTYGGIDRNLDERKLTYFPLTNTYPAANYWGIDLSSCTYGSRMIIKTRIAGILDTGDPKILIPDDLFQVYVDTIPGAEFIKKTGLIEIPPSYVEHMQELHFKFGDHTFTLDGESQLLPQSMNTELGGDVGKHYGIIGPIGHFAGDVNDVDFVLGIPFMRKYYTVYDADKRRIGFAPSQAIQNEPDQNTAGKSKSPSPTTSSISKTKKLLGKLLGLLSAPTTSSDSAYIQHRQVV
ncbi:Aspartic peptidase domain containing protein [Tylopilus felleus]